MPAGIRVTVEFPSPPVCPIADIAARTGTVVNDVSTSVASDGCVSEFLVDADATLDDCDADLVFTYADRHLYRVEHDADTDCPCTCLGEFDTPIDRYYARDGDLEVVFHAPEFGELQTVVGELRDRFPDADIQRLVRAPTEATARDTVFVDRGKLTDRQLEVLETAHERGYFERPRGANATELAEELGISPSTFTEHLLAAQSKLFDDVLEAGD